jgi:hypothetical protein
MPDSSSYQVTKPSGEVVNRTVVTSPGGGMTITDTPISGSNSIQVTKPSGEVVNRVTETNQNLTRGNIVQFTDTPNSIFVGSNGNRNISPSTQTTIITPANNNMFQPSNTSPQELASQFNQQNKPMSLPNIPSPTMLQRIEEGLSNQRPSPQPSTFLNTISGMGKEVGVLFQGAKNEFNVGKQFLDVNNPVGKYGLFGQQGVEPTTNSDLIQLGKQQDLMSLELKPETQKFAEVSLLTGATPFISFLPGVVQKGLFGLGSASLGVNLIRHPEDVGSTIVDLGVMASPGLINSAPDLLGTAKDIVGDIKNKIDLAKLNREYAGKLTTEFSDNRVSNKVKDFGVNVQEVKGFTGSKIDVNGETSNRVKLILGKPEVISKDAFNGLIKDNPYDYIIVKGTKTPFSSSGENVNVDYFNSKNFQGALKKNEFNILLK